MKKDRTFDKIENAALVGYNIYYLVGHNQEERQNHRCNCQVKHGGKALIPDLGSRQDLGCAQ